MHIEAIAHNATTYALILHQVARSTHTAFATPEQSELQVGVVVKEAAEMVAPHHHNCKPFTISRVQECVYVVSGAAEITFFTETGFAIKTVRLKPKTIVITMSGGHSFKFIKKTVLLEVKQGPHSKNKKVFFDQKTT